MKFAICNEMFDQPTAASTFELVRSIGYSGLEIAPFTLAPDDEPFDVRAISDNRIEQLRADIAEAGLQVVGLHWLLAKSSGLHLTSPEPSVRRATADYLVALAECCHALGGDIMVFGSPAQRNLLPGVSHQDGVHYAADVLAPVMPVCERLGVTVALEPLGPSESDFMLTAASAIEVAREVDSRCCKLHLDVKAMASESEPIPQIIDRSREWVRHFHANDPNLLGPGMGDVDFQPIIHKLIEIGYGGWVSVEPFRYEPSAETVARLSLANLQSVL